MFLVTRSVLIVDEINRWKNPFRRLNQIAQLESLRHVKRVQKKFVEGGLYLSYTLLLTKSEYSSAIASLNAFYEPLVILAYQ